MHSNIRLQPGNKYLLSALLHPYYRASSSSIMKSENVSIKYSFGVRDSQSSGYLETFVTEAPIACPGWLSLFTIYVKSPWIVIIIFKISGQILAREWTKYECGVFSELGYKDDRLYPALFRAGNLSRPTAGRVQPLPVKLVKSLVLSPRPQALRAPPRGELSFRCSRWDF